MGFAERSITCCFTGHRPEKLPWGDNENDSDCMALKRRISRAVLELYERGCRHFISGMAKGADLYFAEIVLALREIHPDMTLEAAIPCPTQADRWRAEERERYQAVLRRCDLETVVQQHYDRYCMLRRDRYMVDRSSVLLAVYNGSSGGTRYTIGYAMDHGVEVVMLDL